ncbi:unnamed protein product [Euphydryas editha]|uniref:Uncharacterized protein n=1 Tax=Euphydryas editha TaxID=104508 RepID=A0AAU9UZW4_EUPED|nr:unnamed protein product [Euphydryas editha]
MSRPGPSAESDVLRSQQSSSSVSSSSREPTPAQHFLQGLGNKKRRYAGCYNIHRQNGTNKTTWDLIAAIVLNAQCI